MRRRDVAALSRSGRWRGAFRGLTASAAVLVLCAVPQAEGHAAPKPTAKQLRAELARLQKRSDSMIAEYYTGRVALQKAEKAEKAAAGELRGAQEDFDQAAREVRTLAAQRYRTGIPGTLPVLMSASDPADLLNQMALMQQIMEGRDARLNGFAQVKDTYQRAKASAEQRAKELRDSLRKLGEQKKRTLELIDTIKDRIDRLYPTPGTRRADGTWVPQLPSGPDNITPRMRLVRQLVAQRFSPHFGIGCYRVDGGIAGGGEHPLGRACDFMMSSGGSMPSAGNVRLGDEVAAWAIENKDRLGVKYVIWRQRINTGSGWRGMSNRGGVTANHYDHVHISVH
ncbi:coiled-coil domain-containing protein [Streptosporangium sp. NPDC001559]|uniref:coiled-coil domain-containing protein n=1 Tax=Streptosporangium sp. NPDC001559 TaxID=3366187 RepID=UPI0036E7F37D